MLVQTKKDSAISISGVRYEHLLKRGRCPSSDAGCPLSATENLHICPPQEKCLSWKLISSTVSPHKPSFNFNYSYSWVPTVLATQHCFSFLRELRTWICKTSASASFSCWFSQVGSLHRRSDLVLPFVFFTYCRNIQKSRIYDNILYQMNM